MFSCNVCGATFDTAIEAARHVNVEHHSDAERIKALEERLKQAEAALRDILGYCDEKPEDCRIYEHMVAREYFAKHGEKGKT